MPMKSRIMLTKYHFIFRETRVRERAAEFNLSSRGFEMLECEYDRESEEDLKTIYSTLLLYMYMVSGDRWIRQHRNYKFENLVARLVKPNARLFQFNEGKLIVGFGFSSDLDPQVRNRFRL